MMPNTTCMTVMLYSQRVRARTLPDNRTAPAFVRFRTRAGKVGFWPGMVLSAFDPKQAFKFFARID